MAKILKKGSKGSDVKHLQQLLNKHGKPSPKLDADGEYGDQTEKAVRGFQKVHKLGVDGIAGPATLMALENGGVKEAPAAAGKGKGKLAGKNVSSLKPILAEAVQAVADHYGVTIHVNSTKRSPAEQAQAMWDNWKGVEEGGIYKVLARDAKLLASLREMYNKGDRSTFLAEMTKIATKSRLSLHQSGDAVDLATNTNPKAVKALATMFHYIAEKQCHHFDTKKKPSKIDDAARAKWPK